MKRTLYLTINLVIILLLIAEITCSAETLIAINSSITGTENDTTVSKKYTTIQEAINQANPGETITIIEGTYIETLTITKPLTLQGEGKENTILSPTSKKNGCAIEIKSPDVTLKDLTISNNGPGLYTTAIKITSPRTTIENCQIQDTPVGIAIWSSDNMITNCILTRCSDEGILLIGTSESECINNRIDSCTFTKNVDGIEATKTKYTTISNCVFTENTHDGISFIGNANTNTENTITQCTITDNSVHGIYLSGSENHITSCTFSNNNNGNIALTKESTNNEINLEGSGQTPVKNTAQPLRDRFRLFFMFFQRNLLRFQ
ncbi:MAG: right-handed parallel beta-helix repeat-containing protein [Methanobacteriota archaeon]